MGAVAVVVIPRLIADAALAVDCGKAIADVRGQIGMVGIDTGIDDVDVYAAAIVAIGVVPDAGHAPWHHLRCAATHTTTRLTLEGMYFAIQLHTYAHRVGPQALPHSLRSSHPTPCPPLPL